LFFLPIRHLFCLLLACRDEDVLARGLELNDSLQVVLARHDAIASGVSLPLLLQAPEPRETSSSLKTCGAAALESADSESSSSSSSSESETDEVEDVKDDFIQLAKRLTIHSLTQTH